MPPRLLATVCGALSSTLFASPGHAQQVVDAVRQPADCVVYTTPSASDAWLVTLTHWSLPQQIAAVRHRLACDAGLRPIQTGVCYMGVSALTPRPPRPVDPRPEGLGLFCVIDGYPLFYPISPAFQHLVTPRSVKKLTFMTSQQASALYGSNARGGWRSSRPKARARPVGSGKQPWASRRRARGNGKT